MGGENIIAISVLGLFTIGCFLISIITKIKWLFLIIAVLVISVVIYAIISSIRIERENK